VKVYAEIDPLTGREIRLHRTCRTERAAQIELGKLLAMAQVGRQPDSGPGRPGRCVEAAPDAPPPEEEAAAALEAASG
jgi:hypothetical protein